MITGNEFLKIEESIDSMIKLVDEEILKCKSKENKTCKDENLWFEEFERISTKLKCLRVDMIFTLEIKEAEE